MLNHHTENAKAGKEIHVIAAAKNETDSPLISYQRVVILRYLNLFDPERKKQ
ncbi:hypothetical protein JYB62_05070 [Algoriphagus lutimaris]|uniref:hypothetical protein n=1 Tax=Algoriphagus lutimaris TaxID=613197 RepID=UPI00196B6F5D|nr:hypothetical protein [Algoriphagus lutimaris]MBN3519365.1 hypothetical protein [Algoriphagus lutimaris]